MRSMCMTQKLIQVCVLLFNPKDFDNRQPPVHLDVFLNSQVAMRCTRSSWDYLRGIAPIISFMLCSAIIVRLKAFFAILIGATEAGNHGRTSTWAFSDPELGNESESAVTGRSPYTIRCQWCECYNFVVFKVNTGKMKALLSFVPSFDAQIFEKY